METEPPLPARAEYRLIIVSDTSIRTFALNGHRWIIGRSRECDLVLADPAVSRQQLQLERHGDELRFLDIGGVNPVLGDGQVLRSGVWQPGQTLVVGVTRLTLDRHNRHVPVCTDDSSQTAVISREDFVQPSIDAAPPIRSIDPTELSRMLESMEWVVADLASPEDIAEPLLQLALNVTGRRRGVIGMLEAAGELRTLAAADRVAPDREIRVPLPLLRQGREARMAFQVTTQSHGEVTETLVVPLGPGPAGLLLLADPWPEAPGGQAGLRLAGAIGNIVWHRLEETSNRLAMQTEVEQLRRHDWIACEGLLASGRLVPLRAELRQVASRSTPVLLLGEPGADLESLARYLHAVSPRGNAEFTALEAGSPQDSGQFDLFGPGPGGRILLRANRGTLYVEGPERLPAAAQHQLATVLGTGELRHQGRTVRFDARLVVGTTADPHQGDNGWLPELAAIVDRDRFVVPPLRTDARDVLALADLVLTHLEPTAGGQPHRLSARAQRLLADYAWPGNERQLRSILEAAAEAAGNEPIAPRHLPPEIQALQTGDPELLALEEMEKRHIRDVLERLNGNRARAAVALGIASSTLYEKIKRYRLDV